ncbi:MAG: 3-oxoacyl-[acyl-carrier-protein] reductase FabG [bacterium]|nr:3-oxoacyl-[acyl-carrier-protein] reductase FabG [bacterium]
MNRVALITGASRGIGRAIALALAGRGWSIVVNYRSGAQAAAAVVAVIAQTGGQAHGVQANISESAGRAALVAETLQQYQRLDLLVNNAGMAPRQRVDLLTTSEASYDEVMAVNLKGPFFLTQLVAGKMIELKAAGRISDPRIINIGSLSAYTSSTNRPEYCLSKAGVAMMTKLFAHRLAEHGIGVYEIRPGIIATDMTSAVKDKYDRLIEGGLIPLKRWGLPEDVAQAVVAIAEGFLPYSTGEVINVDGGFHFHRL